MVVAKPNCSIGRDNLDFGRGFYLTAIQKQAEEWARRTTFDRGNGVPTVNIYEFDRTGAMTGAKYKIFQAYDEDWLEFIVSCRRGDSVWRHYDIIEGGVANDRVIDTVRLYIYGFVNKEYALGELSKHQPNNQICFISQEMLDKYLTLIETVQL